ncbi:MAG: penicillin acylase family protein [Sandarakinorhabdus sp.]|nr:penicillin acylase family protein [Sandarakinorhabdus sp.]
MPKWLAGLLVVLGVVAVVLVGLASWDNLTAHGSVADPVRKRDVRIVRDKWGVPHIFGKTDADVGYGLAIAHAEDDFPNLEEVIAAVRGRGGAITGADGAKVDFAGAFLGANQLAAARYGDLSPATRALVEAYAQGINEYAEKHPSEQRLRGLFPVNGKDIVAGFMLRSPFFFGLDRPLSALIEGKTPPRDAGPPDERGSNGFAVAGRRSSDGVTRLIVNSHQPWAGGVTWWEVVVHSGEGWDFAGALFPGAPYPLLGHNKVLGWTNTVNRPDLIDTFKLTMDAKGENYRVDGQWLPLDTSRVWLRVKLGPLTLPIPRTLYGSIYGPVVKNANGAFALRHAGIGDVRQVEQYYRLNKARDFAEWQKVMAMQSISGTNFVYADAAGHIGMFYNARFPVRASGYDWKGVVPGDTRKTLWTTYYPFSADPMVVDPPAGWVANSNNNPFLSTAPADEQKAAAFPVEMGVETYVTNRALRYQALFAGLGDKPISRDDLLRIKFDKGYDRSGWAGDWYREVMTLDTSKTPDLAAAQKLIGTWDWTLDCKGAADTLVTTAFAQAARFAYMNKPRPDTAAALREAVDLLTKHYGRIDPPLGDFQRLRRGKVDLPLCGGPETLRAIIGEMAPDGRRVGNNGDGFIMLIEWMPDGKVVSHSIHQYGAATMRPLSKHYADQSPLFAAEKWKQVDFGSSEMQLRAQEP